MCQCECKKTTKHCICKEHYAWNPSIFGCDLDRDCDTGQYTQIPKIDCTCMESIFDLLDTCDEFANMPETTLMNSNDKKNIGLLLLFY